jgi:hypothetical protein
MPASPRSRLRSARLRTRAVLVRSGLSAPRFRAAYVGSTSRVPDDAEMLSHGGGFGRCAGHRRRRFIHHRDDGRPLCQTAVHSACELLASIERLVQLGLPRGCASSQGFDRELPLAVPTLVPAFLRGGRARRHVVYAVMSAVDTGRIFDRFEADRHLGLFKLLFQDPVERERAHDGQPSLTRSQVHRGPCLCPNSSSDTASRSPFTETGLSTKASFSHNAALSRTAGR